MSQILWQSSGSESTLPQQCTQVWSLVGKLRSPELPHVVKNLKTKVLSLKNDVCRMTKITSVQSCYISWHSALSQVAKRVISKKFDLLLYTFTALCDIFVTVRDSVIKMGNRSLGYFLFLLKLCSLEPHYYDGFHACMQIANKSIINHWMYKS